MLDLFQFFSPINGCFIEVPDSFLFILKLNNHFMGPRQICLWWHGADNYIYYIC